MFDDILGRDEEIFYEGDENPIEFEYEPGPSISSKSQDYGEDDEQEEEPFHERLRKFIKDYYGEPEVDGDKSPCDGDCDDCKPEGPLSCRICGEGVTTPKAVHHNCYEKVVKLGKWKYCYYRR